MRALSPRVPIPAPRRPRGAATILPALLVTLALSALGITYPAAAQGGLWPGSAPVLCTVPITYRIGNVDARFGVDTAEFAAAVREAAALWDREIDGPAFVAAPRGELVIELEFDERQERWHARQEAEASLTTLRDRYDGLLAELEGHRATLREARQRHDQLASAYRNRREHYEAQSRSWHREEDYRPGGARYRAAAVLQQMLLELEGLAETEERARERFNASLAAVRSLAEDLDDKISRLNEQFSEHRGFDKALFAYAHRGGISRRSITIFQFDDRADLRQVLAHELGHALGIGHVADPAALMFYRVTSENRGLTRLAEADRAALADACGTMDVSPAAGAGGRASGSAR
ncbi:MAG: peptidase M10A and M12B matrixin and adamalysin [Thioalkalivibrio sp.]|nr:MAG: peptidase M10A and M12B matrixin and adamalysin [Thioalkalivibrio sp.]